MTHKKVLILSSLAFPIVTAVILPRFFEDLPLVETPSQAMAQVSTQNVPSDFNWKIYIQNYEDLRRAGIDTKEKAMQHWLEFGKNEGRNYRTLIPVQPAVEAPAEAAKSFDVTPIAVSQSIPRVSRERPNFDPADLRKKYDNVLQRAGIKTKEEAMEFSLAFWEKRRKVYFS